MTISPVMPVYNRDKIAFERGEGAYLYSKSGEEYLDFLSGIAVNSLGNCHPHMVAELKAQIDKVWHVSNAFSIDPLTKLSERLVENTFADSAFFCNSGAEAIEAGIKATRKYFDEIGQPNKHRIITFEGAFHGRTSGAIAATGTPKALEGFEPRLQGFDKVPVDLDAVKAAITEDTAAILVEPVQGEGGLQPLPDGFLSALRKICDEHDLLLFLDEVQCGNGRTGKLYAYEWCKCEPDILSTAKGLGGGFPIGACLMKEKVAITLKAGSHGTTFGGNPLACAAANAVLDIMLEDGFFDKVNAVAAYLGEQFEVLKKKYPQYIAEVRGVGLMRGLKLVDEYENLALIKILRANKLVCNAAGQNVVRMLPPLIIENKHVDQAIEKIEKSLGEL